MNIATIAHRDLETLSAKSSRHRRNCSFPEAEHSGPLAQGSSLPQGHCDRRRELPHRTAISSPHGYIKHRKANIKHFLTEKFMRAGEASMQWLLMSEAQILSALICFGCVSAMALEQSATTSPWASPAGLEFDHVWIVVTRDAPERAALEKAGLKISPD